jgi:hypothetical protein
LRYRMGDGPHIALNVSLGNPGHWQPVSIA